MRVVVALMWRADAVRVSGSWLSERFNNNYYMVYYGRRVPYNYFTRTYTRLILIMQTRKWWIHTLNLILYGPVKGFYRYLQGGMILWWCRQKCHYCEYGRTLKRYIDNIYIFFIRLIRLTYYYSYYIIICKGG